MDILCDYPVTKSPKFFRSQFVELLFLTSCFVTDRTSNVCKVLCFIFPKSNKKCVYNKIELDKEGFCGDSDGHVPGLGVKTVCSESKYFS